MFATLSNDAPLTRRSALCGLSACLAGCATAAEPSARRSRPAAAGVPLPGETRQLVLAVADSWDSHRGQLMAYTRRDARSPWIPALPKTVPVLLGRNGSAWGRGLRSGEGGGPSKREGDGRAPAGLFRIGKLYGEPDSPPAGTGLHYVRVGEWDAWPDDPGNPHYNRHVRIDPARGVPPWFEKQRMRLGDPAYRWLVEVRHNADPPVPGAGSAIFLHTRRGPDRPSAGCTVMARADLEAVIRLLDADAAPVFALLPRTEYTARRTAWGLPDLP